MRFPWRAVALFFVSMIGAGGAGALVAYLLISPPTPESLESAVVVSSATVVAQPFADPKPIDVVISRGADLELRLARGGLLTSRSCSVGAQAVSGGASFAVDGVPLVNLHTTVPLWRNLVPGDRGVDVDALKGELGRLGREVSPGPRLGSTDLKSLSAVMVNAGREVTLDAVAPGDFVWLPSPELVFSSCDADVSAAVEAGDSVASADGGVTVSLGAPPMGLLPGARVLTVDDVVLALDESLGMTDLSAAASVARTASYREALGEGDGIQPVTITATIELVEPIPASALPPSAVTITGDASGCVTDGEGMAHPVGILTSQLGSTVVSFESDAPASVLLNETSSCS